MRGLPQCNRELRINGFTDEIKTALAGKHVYIAYDRDEASEPTARQAHANANAFSVKLLNEISVEPITLPIAFRAGRIDDSLQAKGLTIALGDLLIGATALELSYAVVTHNARHFQVIPNLDVKQL